jgi:uncharacterized membrane protein
MERVLASGPLTASATVAKDSSNVYYGYTVLVVTAVGSINIRKTSQTGLIMDIIPAATVAGSARSLAHGLQCEGGIYVEFAGGATGTLIVHFE